MSSGDSALQSNKVTSTLAVFTKDCTSDQSLAHLRSSCAIG